MHTSLLPASSDLTTASKASGTAALLPIMAVVAFAFLIIGVVLPALPLHVHLGLGLGAFMVGVVTGSQFLASILSRVWAGHAADRRGPKCAVMAGPPWQKLRTWLQARDQRMRGE
jgi:MFS family permease